MSLRSMEACNLHLHLQTRLPTLAGRKVARIAWCAAWPSLSADESCTEAIGRIRQDPCIHALCDCLLRYAPCAARKGSATFLQSIRFLIARFRVDYWWYGILSQLASFEAVDHFGQQMATLTGHSDGS